MIRSTRLTTTLKAMKGYISFLVVFVLVTAAAFAHHHKECHTKKCDRNADRLWAKHHPQRDSAWTITAFDLCVARHESTMYRYADNGVDESYYQWLPSTWRSAERLFHVWFSSSPFDATFAQQTYVFNKYYPIVGHTTAGWPRTGRMCGG